MKPISERSSSWPFRKVPRAVSNPELERRADQRQRNPRLKGMLSNQARVNVDPDMLTPVAVNGYSTHPNWQITQGGEDPQRSAYIDQVLARLRARKVVCDER